MHLFLENEHIFSNFDDFNERKDAWTKSFQKLKAAGLTIYEPKGSHLYNTFLIDVHKCPLGIVNSLAQKNIYVGTASACKNEELVNNADQSEHISGGNKPFDKSIRISFSKSKEIDDPILDEIIDEIKNSD